jgi:hypothetical protein
MTPTAVERVAFSKAEICIRNGISQSTLHKLEQQGLGPKYMRAGNLIRCSLEAEREWQRMLANLDPTEAHERAVVRAKKAGAAAAVSPKHVSRRRKKTRTR